MLRKRSTESCQREQQVQTAARKNIVRCDTHKHSVIVNISGASYATATKNIENKQSINQ